MTPKEQEIAIGEVEERVDRLRVLYDQYFLGFEKLEPTVPRKDVERRMAILRKEQIRNTALRFRFNVVTQKYNTYGMYWLRIARQIEEGTFKRHIRRAEARFGGRRERDLSIDVDLTDFDNFEVDMDEDMDMDAVLAEANAAAEAYDRGGAGSDTIPPGAPTSERVPSSIPARGSVGRQMAINTPGTSFVVGGRRESLDDMEPSTPPPDSVQLRAGQPDRVARPAALPPGGKPRIVVRKVGAARGGPESEPGIPAAPSSQRTPAPMPGAGRPPGGILPPGAPAPSAGRIAAAPPAGPSARTPSGGGVPLPPPNPLPASERRIPIPASAPNMPARPAIGRIGAARPAPAPSAGRMPVAAPAPAQGQPGGPAARPPARPSIPDEYEKDTIPPGPPSAPASIPPRPRAPLPLPSQVKKK